MKNLFPLFILFICSALAIGSFTACSDDSCSIAGRSMINCVVYTINPETNEVENDTIASLTVTALGTDSIIINNESNVHTLSLPLTYVSDTTILVFHYDYATDPANSDTLYIRQVNTPYFESMECGYSMLQEIAGVTYTQHELSSITINNTHANVNGTENLKLYYRYSH